MRARACILLTHKSTCSTRIPDIEGPNGDAFAAVLVKNI